MEVQKSSESKLIFFSLVFKVSFLCSIFEWRISAYPRILPYLYQKKQSSDQVLQSDILRFKWSQVAMEPRASQICSFFCGMWYVFVSSRAICAMPRIPHQTPLQPRSVRVCVCAWVNNVLYIHIII